MGHQELSTFPQTFLSSPIDTIVASTDFTYSISRHDLLEAYHTLNLRLITLTKGFEAAVVDGQEVNMQIQALAPLESNRSLLFEALKRDIRGALENSLPPTSVSYPYNVSLIYQDSDFSTPDDVQRANEVVMLCHYSLRVVSTVFHISILQSVIEVEDLASLLNSVLSLWTSTPLPSPNSRKTRAFIIWTLKVQRLSPTVLSCGDVNKGILNVLKGALEDEQTEIISDCLQAFKHLLLSNPTFYLEALSNNLPQVMLFLVSTDVELQNKSAELLGELGMSLLNNSDITNCGKGKGKRRGADIKDVWDTCACHVRSFIDSQTSHRCTTPTKMRLRHILSAALGPPSAKQVDSESPNNIAGWSIHVLFNLITLSSSPSLPLFLHAPSLKLFFGLIGDAISSPKKDIRRAGEHGWKMLLWAFWRLYQTNGYNELVRKAFKTVKQELRGGIGGLLVAILLYDNVMDDPDPQSGSRHAIEVGFGADEAVKMALEVISDMVQSSRKQIAHDGVKLLARLMANSGASASTIRSEPSTPVRWIPSHALEQFFIDGRCLVAGLSVSLDAGASLPSEALKQLSDREIMAFWDLLAELWTSAVKRLLVEVLPDGGARMKQQVFNDLVQIWHSLLLSQAQLTQDHEHLTSHSIFAERAAYIISAFLEDKVALVTVDAQKCRLDLVSKLWRLMENTFSASWLSIPAKYLLGIVATLKFDLADEAVKHLWETLINGLVAAGDDLLLGLLDYQGRQLSEGASITHQVETPSQEPHQTLFRRQLWRTVATRWDARHDGRIHWTDVVEFIGTPFGHWVMGDGEIQLWSDMLQYAISAAQSFSVRPVVVVEKIFLQLSERKVDRSSRVIDVATLLVSNINFSPSEPVPEELFMIIDDILQHLYPPQAHDLHDSLQFLIALKAIIIACPPSLFLPVLMIIQNGLCIWIVDKEEAVPDTSYNDAIITIYTEVISKISSLPLLGLETLNALTPLLVSAFTQVRHGARGPLAFEKFWKATYHGREDVLHSIPKSLRLCLKSFDDAYDRGLATGLSHDTQSQSTTGSIAPDSQRSHVAPNAVVEPSKADINPTGSPQTTSRAISHITGSVSNEVDRSYVPTSPHDEIAMDSSSILDGLQRLTPSPSHFPGPPRPAVSQSRSDPTSDFHGRNESGLLISRQTPGVETRSSKRRQLVSSPIINYRPAKRTKTDSRVSRNEDSAPERGLKHSKEVSRTRLKFDGVEVPTLKQILAQEKRRLAKSRQKEDPPDSDDFGGREAGLSLSELHSLDSGDVSVPTTQMWDTSETDILRTSSPELREMHMGRSLSPFRRAHSQSAVQISPKPPLRRAKTTTDRLKILYDARKLVESDASEMADHDVVEGCRLASEIQATMSAQLVRRLGTDIRGA